MARVVVVGGGFNGRLIQAQLPVARVFDWRPEKPVVENRSLGPQYLWEPLPGLPCRKFSVTTLVDGRVADDASVLRYKCKVGKEQDQGDWKAQFQYRMDGYDVTLPEDTVEYGQRIVSIDLGRRRLQMSHGGSEMYDYLVSTIPLFSLLGMIRTGAFEGVARLLRFRPIYVSTTPLSWWGRLRTGPNMRVNYLSSPDVPWYRETERDGAVFREALTPAPNTTKLIPGKIYACPHARNALRVLGASGVFAFGRFASWSPDELAHETFRQVQRWIEQEGLR
jgi:hypothetical protein